MIAENHIPWADLTRQTKAIQSELRRIWESILDGTDFIGGTRVKSFEKAFGLFLKCDNVIGVANGTDSLEIILQALDIGNGDEVIIPALSWASTAECVLNVGATPVYIDIDSFYTIDVAAIEGFITKKTKAIIAVHLYGQVCDMDALLKIAEHHEVFLVEDCAQAHGSMWNNAHVGTLGHAGSFSFYPGKNLGAFGDAGCITTQSPEMADKCRMIANHGQKTKHQHLMRGRNSRIDALQADILNLKLAYLPTWINRRREIASAYHGRLMVEKKPMQRNLAKHSFHLYVVEVSDRNSFVSELQKDGIGTSIHYPKPLSEFEKSIYYGPGWGQCINAKRACDGLVSLPMFPELTDQEIDQVINVVNKHYK